MLLQIIFAAAAYQYQKLDFIPRDINDNGWIVGETRVPAESGWKTAAILYAEGKMVNLGSFNGTGSALSVNAKGHVLMECQPNGLPKRLSRTKPKLISDKAYLLWSNGNAKFIGFSSSAIKLMDSNKILTLDGLWTIKNGKSQYRSWPKIPSCIRGNESYTAFLDMNESGTRVGVADFGYGLQTHAIVVDNHGKLSDIHPNVEMRTGWGARLINSKGTVLGYEGYDTSIGGGVYFLWRRGKRENLPGFEVNRPTASVAAMNDLDNVVGCVSLSESGSYLHEMANQEFYKPHIATVVSHAILWKDGKMLNLNDLVALPKGTVLTSAAKINNKGWIIGTAIADGKRFGYVLKSTGK